MLSMLISYGRLKWCRDKLVSGSSHPSDGPARAFDYMPLISHQVALTLSRQQPEASAKFCLELTMMGRKRPDGQPTHSFGAGLREGGSSTDLPDHGQRP